MTGRLVGVCHRSRFALSQGRLIRVSFCPCSTLDLQNLTFYTEPPPESGTKVFDLARRRTWSKRRKTSGGGWRSDTRPRLPKALTDDRSASMMSYVAAVSKPVEIWGHRGGRGGESGGRGGRGDRASNVQFYILSISIMIFVMQSVVTSSRQRMEEEPMSISPRDTRRRCPPLHTHNHIRETGQSHAHCL